MSPSSSSSSSSSSMGGCGSLALAAATAVAFSGSLVIFSLCRAHMSAGAAPPTSSSSSMEPALRPCLCSSSDKRRRGRKTTGPARRKAEKKRVRFADDVVDNEGAPRPARAATAGCCRGVAEERMMPANREALYRGMLRDRSAHRVTCSY